MEPEGMRKGEIKRLLIKRITRAKKRKLPIERALLSGRWEGVITQKNTDYGFYPSEIGQKNLVMRSIEIGQGPCFDRI
jgi:hypothetical protein